MWSIRVLYDISALGLGQVSEYFRCGSYRADHKLVEYLATSGECELVFCANFASVAYDGCVAYLRDHRALGHLPLLPPQESPLRRGLRGAIAQVHRVVKSRRRDRPLPRLARAAGMRLDASVRRAVLDASPPADIHHSSSTPLPPPPKGRRVPKRFVTIYDIRPSPDLMSGAQAEYQRALVASVREDDWVLTTSESTRRDLAGVGIPPARVRVVPLAADRSLFRADGAEPSEAVRAQHAIPPGPFFLVLNSRHPHKNVARAVQAFVRMVQENPIGDLSLVLVGSTDGSEMNMAGMNGSAVRKRIIRVGYVSDSALAALYRGATAFVYPSLYEGFGLPALEAMQCGAPVITSCSSSLPEVVADAAITVDPHDVDAIGAAMLAVQRDGALRESLRTRGLARAASFTWERTAACTIASYRAALEA